MPRRGITDCHRDDRGIRDRIIHVESAVSSLDHIRCKQVIASILFRLLMAFILYMICVPENYTLVFPIR